MAIPTASNDITKNSISIHWYHRVLFCWLQLVIVYVHIKCICSNIGLSFIILFPFYCFSIVCNWAFFPYISFWTDHVRLVSRPNPGWMRLMWLAAWKSRERRVTLVVIQPYFHWLSAVSIFCENNVEILLECHFTSKYCAILESYAYNAPEMLWY